MQEEDFAPSPRPAKHVHGPLLVMGERTAAGGPWFGWVRRVTAAEKRIISDFNP